MADLTGSVIVHRIDVADLHREFYRLGLDTPLVLVTASEAARMSVPSNGGFCPGCGALGTKCCSCQGESRGQEPPART